MAAKAAGDAEDYAMDAGNESEAPARDPASLQRVEQVQVTSEEIDRMTPQLITAAQVGHNTRLIYLNCLHQFSHVQFVIVTYMYASFMSRKTFYSISLETRKEK